MRNAIIFGNNSLGDNSMLTKLLERIKKIGLIENGSFMELPLPS